MVSAALAAGVLHQLLPESFRVEPHWIYPVFLVVFLVVLIVGDPGVIDRDYRWLRVTTGLMIGLITAVNGVAALRLVVKILTGAEFGSARELFATGAIVWLINVITFALWFWDLDGGGAAARAATHDVSSRTFVFPEMTLTGPTIGSRSLATTWRCPSTRRQLSVPPMCRPSEGGPR